MSDHWPHTPPCVVPAQKLNVRFVLREISSENAAHPQDAVLCHPVTKTRSLKRMLRWCLSLANSSHDAEFSRMYLIYLERSNASAVSMMSPGTRMAPSCLDDVNVYWPSADVTALISWVNMQAAMTVTTLNKHTWLQHWTLQTLDLFPAHL